MLKDMTNEESIEILNEAIKLLKPFDYGKFAHRTVSLKTQKDLPLMQEICKKIPIEEIKMNDNYTFFKMSFIHLLMETSGMPIEKPVSVKEKKLSDYDKGYQDALKEEGYIDYNHFHKNKIFQVESIETDNENNIVRFLSQSGVK